MFLFIISGFYYTVSFFMKRNAAPPAAWTGAGGGQDFLATGRGRWYRDASSD
jgi:hypothetical protein